jgi:hypothetical protein
MRDRDNIDARQGSGGNAGSLEGGYPYQGRVSAPSSTAEVIQKPFRRDKIRGIKTLREAIVDRLETGGGVGGTSLIAQQASEARRRAQLQC